MHVIRHSPDAAQRDQLRSVSSKLLSRAERIKQLRKDDLRPLKRNRLSDGLSISVGMNLAYVCMTVEQSAVLDKSSRVNELVFPSWTGFASPSSYVAPYARLDMLTLLCHVEYNLHCLRRRKKLAAASKDCPTANCSCRTRRSARWLSATLRTAHLLRV